MFETNRLRLRAFEPSDTATYHDWWNDPLLVPLQTTAAVRPVSAAASAATVQAWAQESLIFCTVETLADKTMIGAINLWGGDPKNRDYRLAIVLGRQFWGHGFGREILDFFIRHAFRELGVHRISLQVAAHNERAIRCYRAVGFKEEGRLRQANFRAGAWHDEILMGLLSEDLPPTHP